MAAVREFALPDLGEGLTSAEIVRWLVEVGEVVAVDQPVVEVETAKAVVEVPCPYGGVVTSRFGAEGEEVAVGTPLVTVATAPSASDAEEPGDSGSGNVLVGYGTRGPRPRRRRVSHPGTPGSAGGPAGRSDEPPRTGATTSSTRSGGTALHAGPALRERPDPASADAPPVPVISPLVRRMARTHGLDLREVRGSGPEGLVMRADVERAIAAAAEAPAAESATPADAELVPLRGAARLAAEKFARSRREIPDATCWVEADATELLSARDALNTGQGQRIGLLALFARIAVLALQRHPELNSTVVGGPDGGDLAIRRNPSVHLGLAAQTDRGLMVPVVRGADRLPTGELAATIAATTEAARQGKLAPADLTGGTFTLNNYGVFGVDGSTPIINHPEAAMLGVGRIAAKPWVHQGQLAVRQVVQLSLAFDHRVCDGAIAGRFLREVADAVEHPITLLREL